MKRFILIMLTFVSFMTVSAQSVELHQSYGDDKSAFGSTRLLVEYFWSTDDARWNVFSWNSFSVNGINALIYGEYQFRNNWYIHPELRIDNGNFKYTSITPQIGFAYKIPWNNGPDVYLTPKYSYNGICGAKHDVQFSINSSYENDFVYYEGYIDTNWVNAFSVFAEQKAYYKITKHIQAGLCGVFNSTSSYGNGGNCHAQLYGSVRLGF